ncbi:MAG: divergent polysaccharide deacetylase family protein [Candidatus Omnitrophica bacterium]|nr:divergent polysaccharide deacetylase family protein [Candidatus Omnitrophota bacterium]MDE2008813.1 divergent polysaccharide deacetylase family protein [Candidatus Omnitrophota bacterium]MDE2213624.1 divergent polysaccharide deacetylase family protein [Candidatus Omnitrophota bacterium]MDE2230475.1 divergent polysaccharide deacetylase family protein [Candidatus Omnitrophota bacterium]
MIKRKLTLPPDNDSRVAAIVTGLFVAVVILLFIFSKVHEGHRLSAQHLNKAPKIPVSAVKASLRPKIAFILDDWGYSTIDCKYLAEIPEPLAVSILPGLRHTQDAAACARRAGKLTMLHLPMEAMQNYDFYYPKNYIIKTTMSPGLVTAIVNNDLAQLPSVEGVNNHMGSKATADGPLMRIILRILRKRELFFVDSMTSRHSVAGRMADEMGLRFARRDVFLDNVNTRPAIDKQLVVLAHIARRRGYAVAIGHDRRLTMQVLKDEIPWLEKQGFAIVSIKDLLKGR